MRYEKAQFILPEHLVEMIQQYIDGSYIYIPRKSENRKAWGEQTRIKKALNNRNQMILESYLKGDSIQALSARYYLTEPSIRRIIRSEKMKL